MNQQQRPLSALPSVFARAVAYVSIIIAGIAGALIGFTLVDLQCQGNCDVPNSIGLILGAATGALGMGVVAVLVLRATGEWKELEDRK
jgi:putative effector of murein hydrolase